MATISGLNISTPKLVASAKPQLIRSPIQLHPWNRVTEFGSIRMKIQPVRAAPEKIAEKVEESIKNAEQTCSEDPASGECVAAWDEVEELSAAASHARDRQKGTDPLDAYCKDNPETDECRTYDD